MYYFGIVDFLQDWTLNKKIERTGKIYLFRHDPSGVSVMEPEAYKKRFQAKMIQIFDIAATDDHMSGMATFDTPVFRTKPPPGMNTTAMITATATTTVSPSSTQRQTHRHQSLHQDGIVVSDEENRLFEEESRRTL